MFELIRANKRRSMVLVFVMLALLLVLGFVIGAALIPSIGRTEFSGDSVQPHFYFDPTGGFVGMGVAFLIWTVQSLIAYYQGGKILLSVSRARQIEKADHPQLFNVVEEMTIASRLPKMPDVYIIDDMAMNAFATGRDPDHAAVAVTAGLLGRMNRDQLQGVIAHEIGHVVNRDVLFMTMVGIMVGSVVMISEVFLRSMFYGSMMGHSRRYRSSSRREGGGAQAIVMIAAVILAIVTPLLAQAIYFALSRKREYLADASAAVYTRYPEGLASALEALSGDTQVLASANKTTAPMYIINPLHPEGSMALNMTSTHPPLQERIKILRGMAGGVSYGTYQEAWGKAVGSRAARMPVSAEAVAPVAARKPHADVLGMGRGTGGARNQMREAGDLLRKVNDFLFLSCVCGMRIKLPPEFKHDHVGCPRCKKSLAVPIAQLAAIQTIGKELGSKDKSPPAQKKTASGAEQPLSVTLKGPGWQSFKCSCGAVKNLAPSFKAPQCTCAKCKRKIAIRRS
jgi:heat shock protein HtpX